MATADSDQPGLRIAAATAVLLTLSSLALGVWGYAALGFSLLDAGYRTLQLFALDGPAESGGGHPALALARFTAPFALVAVSVLAAVAVVGRRLRHAARLRRVGDHTAVLGLSDGSSDLAMTLLAMGEDVTVVELDSDHPRLPELKRAGGLVVAGDAVQEMNQRLARVAESHRVVVSTGDDGRNLAAAEIAVRQLQGTRRSTIHVLIGDFWLHEELARTEFTTVEPEGAAVDFVHRVDYEAATFVEAVCSHPAAARITTDPVVLAGGGERCRRVLVHLARRLLLFGEGARIMVDDDVWESTVRPLLPSCPWLEEALVREAGHAAVARTCLVAESESDGAALGTALRSAGRHRTADTFVLTDAEISDALLPGSSRVHVIPSGAVASQPENLYAHSWLDTMARARHQIYCASELRRGVTPSQNTSIRPWTELPESLRESNRDFARSVAQVLEKLPVQLAPLRDLEGATPAAFDNSIEELARREHDRWAADLSHRGWRRGPAPKDPIARTHPLLVDWEELGEEERDKDRDSIRSIPTMLALVGLQIEDGADAG